MFAGERGPPEALVKVWKGYKEEDLKTAKEATETLIGRQLSVKFNTV